MAHFIGFRDMFLLLGCLGRRTRFVLLLAHSYIDVVNRAPEATEDSRTSRPLLLFLALEPSTGRPGIYLILMFEYILALFQLHLGLT